MVNMCLCLHTVKLAGSLVKAKRQLLPVVVRGTLQVCTANTVRVCRGFRLCPQ